MDGPIAEVIRKTAESAKNAFERLSDLAVLNPDYLDRVGGAVGLQTKILIELVKKFDRLYGQAKRAVNCLDFADLEHYALRLLSDENSSEDKLLPSETALALRRKYKYIFVDEYQDINPVQQAILDLLSCGGNVFVVGDVKQSIYAWRGAEPEIFLQRLKPASVDPANASDGLRVDLNANFRSAEGILDFVNKVFARIMTASFTKIDYDESAKLKPASEYKSKEPPPNTERGVVEFHILDEQDKEADWQNHQTDEFAEDENLHPVRNSTTISNGVNVISSRQRQAAMIARRIRQMVGEETGTPEFQIYDKQQDSFRDVEYRDIVILMRSLAKKANDYVEVLRLAGVPVSCEATAGYFEATEISDCLCLLKVLDNPQRDIELAAILRSPFFNISDAELAKIKAHSKTDQQRRNFYDCVLQYCVCGPRGKLVSKLKEILARIEQWRTLARRGNLADLIWQIYRQTDFLSFVSALPNGQARRANLLKLHDRAIQFEGFASSAGNPSLTRFVAFIEKLQEVGQDWAPAEPDSSVENAVRIISVHKSKGLEFPVVFLAELDSRFNKRDIQEDFLADAADTLGLQIIDRQSNSKLSSLAHQVIAEEKLSTALAEEMRILYVATTRARDRLILTASEKRNNCRTIICNGFFFGDESIGNWQLRSCESPLEWLLYGLCDQKNLHKAFETGLVEKADDDDLFSLKLYSQTELKELSRYILKLKANKSSRFAPTARKLQPKRTESRLLWQVKKSLGWQYHFGDVPLLPAKQSVTQLTHRNDEYVKFDYSMVLERKPGAVMATEAGLTEPQGRLIGIVTHLLISKLDLAKPITTEAIEQLIATQAIDKAVAEHIDTKSIIAFFQSNLGQIALDAKNTVCREWPFTFALPASLVARAPSLFARVTSHGSRVTDDETIIVQGIIDMLVQTPQGLAVIDFKTDNVSAEQAQERARVYREQLELYSRAASAILKSKILGKWLYFLTPGCAIEV
ncbi:ATP-dependent helicase/nuclease subunit A [subsurface metagenome]